MSLVSREPFQLTGRYAAGNKWEVIRGPGDARPTALQIVRDEGLEGKALAGKVIFVTGASSGMGPTMVQALAATGATIYVGARDIRKAKGAIGEDLTGGKNPQVRIIHLDQADLSSVRSCAAEFRRQAEAEAAAAKADAGDDSKNSNNKPRLNILINNAAVMKTPEARTRDGHELQFGTNHLSHFLLFYLLKDMLLASATPEFPSRVVNSTSSAHKYAQLNLDNLNLEGEYDAWRAYGQSKLANIYMTNQIERLYGSQNLHGLSAGPGVFWSPNLQQHCTPEEMDGFEKDARLKVYKYDYGQACATAVYGALAGEPVEYLVEKRKGKGEKESSSGGGGAYLEGCAVAGPVPADAEDSFEYGHSAAAFDRENEERLWEVSKVLVGVV